MVGWEARADLFARLSMRRGEIEEAVLDRVQSTSGPLEPQRSRENGLKTAVVAGVNLGLAVAHGEARAPIPAAVLAPAQRSARRGVGLDTVMRDYFAAYALFSDFVVEAAEADAHALRFALRPVLRDQAARFGLIAVAVAGEFPSGHDRRAHPRALRRTESVRRLLAGENIDPAELAYELENWHIGVIARGPGAAAAIRDLAASADRSLLLVRPGRETVWAWLGGRQRLAVAELEHHLASDAGGNALLALGEPARGLDGWRLTHEQAAVALKTAQRGMSGAIRYAKVGLVASVANDRVLAKSLQQLYLAPLEEGRDDTGASLRGTLRAYFATGRNVSSAASALGVSRQTVSNRLRLVEEKIGQTLESCAPEIEVALRLDSLSDVADR